MFEKILFPTDFSDVAVKALQYVKQLRDAGGREVVVLHVIDQSNLELLSSFSTVQDYMTIEKEIDRRATEEIGFISNELRQLGFSVTERIEKGIPLRVVLKVAEEERPSVIVLGSHGKSNLEEMLLGSISEKVVRKSKHPVLVVKR
ncbi:MAG TPA: universal stress protein [Deltaproteobacteria bacterium]|jgi:nucleotide-binding universal stress UspA family protein|nr:universal stress protein [Deltaproteobacteria bacterium]HRW79990.1 universal stress protein [Desulfomonilia bacterium]NMD40606.1 universal stress protein [Deltaproteobacteria bacterium]HNQ85643.1 universal stress protein [Deltaproteobacteria bacterium]HNS89780.1 universal stress protein [Deltaproteobacteria bacterium]